MGRDRNDRGRSFTLLDADERAASAIRAQDLRPGRDDIGAGDPLSREGRDRLASGTGDSRPERDRLVASGQARAESTDAEAPPEPARLRPFLDKAERNLRRTVEGWRKEGMIDAARHLEHFLEGSGEPITYNRDQARSFSPVRNAEEDAQAQIRAGILAEARKLKDGESVEIGFPVRGQHDEIPHGLDLLRGVLGDRDRLNDNLATGRTRVESTFKGTISRDGDKVAVDGSVGHEWQDRYNFRSGQPGADAALSLQKYRGAKPFHFSSAWGQRLTGQIRRRREQLLPDLSFTDVE